MDDAETTLNVSDMIHKEEGVNYNP